jgi:hypothetical protein
LLHCFGLRLNQDLDSQSAVVLFARLEVCMYEDKPHCSLMTEIFYNQGYLP